MDCHQAEPLIPSYLDGELSETRAAPLRRHLLDCQPCRAGAQGERNLKRWFPAAAAVAVPRGFAARVARRAFAGDVGELPVVDSPSRLRPVPATRVGEDGEREDRILQFVLGLTAAAALVLIALAVSMRGSSLPSGSSLRAADGRDQISVEKALERLERLNQAERGEQVRPVKDRRP
jgi:anti-sigma factor RsiW